MLHVNEVPDEMEAMWTPAEDGGPARFSQRYRDGMGDTAYKQWTRAEPAAPGGLGMRSLLPALTAAALLAVLMYGIFHQWRVLRAWYTARQLVAAEEAAAMATAGVEATTVQQPRPSSVGAGPAKGYSVTRRVCRLCDVVVDDAHVESHLGGKKHKKLVSTRKLIDAEGRLVAASSMCCWVYTEFLADTVFEAPAPEEALPAQTAGQADGKGKWVEVPSKAKGAGGAARRGTKLRSA
jgi:hypothetical protein